MKKVMFLCMLLAMCAPTWAMVLDSMDNIAAQWTELRGTTLMQQSSFAHEGTGSMMLAYDQTSTVWDLEPYRIFDAARPPVSPTPYNNQLDFTNPETNTLTFWFYKDANAGSAGVVQVIVQDYVGGLARFTVPAVGTGWTKIVAPRDQFVKDGGGSMLWSGIQQFRFFVSTWNLRGTSPIYIDDIQLVAGNQDQIDSFDNITMWGWNAAQGAIAQETSVIKEGSGSMRLVADSNNIEVYKYYGTPLNATDKYFQFWMYGDGTSNQFQFFLIDTSGNVARYIDYITWTGWRPIVIKASLIGKDAAFATFDYTSVKQIHFLEVPSVSARGNVYIDDLGLSADPTIPMEISYCEPSSPYVYQIDSYSGATHSYDTAVKTEGSSSLAMNFTSAATYEQVCIYLTQYINGGAPNVPKDFTKYGYVEFDLYGDGSGNRLEFRFQTGGNPYYTWLFMTHTGWKHYVLPLGGFSNAGANWASIDSVRFFNPDGTAMNIKLDNLRLIDLTSPTPPYQIASFDNWVADGWVDGRATGLALQENTIIKEGTGSMKINWDPSTTLYDVVPGKVFTPVQNWSNYQNWAVSIWVNGDTIGDSKLYQIIIYDNAAHTGRYTVPKPTSTGWTKVVAKLSDFVWDGGVTPAQVNWNAITKIDLWASCYPTPGNPIYLDDFQIGTPPIPPSDAWVMNAQKATITVDGSAADWTALTDSDELDFDLKAVHDPNGDLHVKYKLAWDANCLYVLVREVAGDLLATEAEGLSIINGLNDGAGGDVYYDNLALFYDFTNTHSPQAVPGSISVWQFLGLSSTNRTDMMMTWTNGLWGPHDPNAIANGSVATSGTLGSRIVEAKLKWSDLAATLTSDRQPAGGLLAAIKPGYVFGCDPRLNDLEGDWTVSGTAGAAWLNGLLWTGVGGKDIYSTDVKLVCKAADITGDCSVNFADFGVLAAQWSKADCTDLNGYCSGADIVIDGAVNITDLRKLAQEWLQ